MTHSLMPILEARPIYGLMGWKLELSLTCFDFILSFYHQVLLFASLNSSGMLLYSRHRKKGSLRLKEDVHTSTLSPYPCCVTCDVVLIYHSLLFFITVNSLFQFLLLKFFLAVKSGSHLSTRAVVVPLHQLPCRNDVLHFIAYRSCRP